MAHFIKCSVKAVPYRRGEIVTNKPVNIDLCKSLTKSQFAWYPDNIGLPSITFNGTEVEWVFPDLKSRDDEFERIASNQVQTK